MMSTSMRRAGGRLEGSRRTRGLPVSIGAAQPFLFCSAAIGRRLTGLPCAMSLILQENNTVVLLYCTAQ